jgi:hypothetical protein
VTAFSIVCSVLALVAAVVLAVKLRQSAALVRDLTAALKTSTENLTTSTGYVNCLSNELAQSTTVIQNQAETIGRLRAGANL